MTLGWLAWIVLLKRECEKTLVGSSMICGHSQITLRHGPESVLMISVCFRRCVPDGMPITTWTRPFCFSSIQFDTTWGRQTWKDDDDIVVFGLLACFLCDDTICDGAGVDSFLVARGAGADLDWLVDLDEWYSAIRLRPDPSIRGIHLKSAWTPWRTSRRPLLRIGWLTVWERWCALCRNRLDWLIVWWKQSLSIPRGVFDLSNRWARSSTGVGRRDIG